MHLQADDTPVTTSAYDRDLLRKQIDILRQEAAIRARLEKEIFSEHERTTSSTIASAKQSLHDTREKYAREIAATEKQYAAVLQQAVAQAASDQEKLDAQRKKVSTQIARTWQSHEHKLKEDDQFEEGSYKEVYKDKRKEPIKLFAKDETELAKMAGQIREADAASVRFLGTCGIRVSPADESIANGSESSAVGPEILKQTADLRTSILEKTRTLCTLKSVKTAFAGSTQAVAITVPIVLGLLAAVGASMLVPGELPDSIGPKSIAGAIAGLTVTGVGLGLGLWLVMRLRAKTRTDALAFRTDLESDIIRAHHCVSICTDFLKLRRDNQITQLDDRYKQDCDARQILLHSRLEDIAAKRDKATAELAEKYQAAKETILQRHSTGKEAAEKKLPPQLVALKKSLTEDLTRLELDRDSRLAAASKQRDSRVQEMTDNWRRVRTETAAVYEEADSIDTAAFRTWLDLARDDVPLPAESPPGLRFGALSLSLEKVPGGVSSDAQLNAFGPIAWSQPAFVPFPTASSLLIKTTGDQKEIASEMMQALMLRIASGVPAGQSRFTIIDPLGLGKHFAGFMHLADYDELLVTSRIWTEPAQIEQRLADITEQMELVIQKYLRNEYESIGAYNADAEVLEPYRFVVVANFPANFNETSARRLASIAASGARCGVYTILSIDTKQSMPAHFDVAEIEQHATTLVLKDGVFTWNDSEYSKWPLAVEKVPTDEVFTQIIPHARVIAIESEREFGLSFLEQLDRELKRRGDHFRDLAVQDLAGFRGTGHPEPMPRVLLIIDEFQELFIEDDKLAQDASLVLDRLVRQGRAFGMHVLLGSQTLGGSYSLPRSTMGQMAVRIALQCNEADSSLILSEENSAARLLTRPGEAIYNDANGLVAGNNPFQVVWLNDERREKYLGALRKLADSRPDIPALPRMVFDGNQAADPAGNTLLSELLQHSTVGGKQLIAPVVWLGDAIAIKDPTTAIFRRQGGANLLVVGQREDLAVSLLAMSIVGLAAAHDPHPGGKFGRPARFVLFEPAIAEEHPDLVLNQLQKFLPQEFETIGRLGVVEAFDSLANEVKRRLDEQVLDGEAVFVIIRDLARFRELRKSEGDFGFSFGNDQKAGPAQNLLNVLKDGPTVGIHALIWCDSLTNLMRTFERGVLKEFELRVLFQISAADSSQLVDSPAASKLGPQRALFIHEETGTLEKFRPYSFPTNEWLEKVSTAIKQRPQGSPVARPVATITSENRGDKMQNDFGADEFNFTKFLDDPPAGNATSGSAES